jgi:hypothetical protein
MIPCRLFSEPAGINHMYSLSPNLSIHGCVNASIFSARSHTPDYQTGCSTARDRPDG